MITESLDWRAIVGLLLSVMGGGSAVLWWWLKQASANLLARVEQAELYEREQRDELKKQVRALEVAQEDMILKHATDRKQWEIERQTLLGQIKTQADEIVLLRQSVNVLEAAYKDGEKRSSILEERTAKLEAELIEKTAALDALRERLHKTEIALAASNTQAQFYQTQNVELFDLLKRYQQVQLTVPRTKEQAA